MTFRTKIFLAFTLALLLSVGAITSGVLISTRRIFDAQSSRRTQVLAAQFQRDFEDRKQEVVHRVHGVAEDEGTVTMAMNLARPNADVSVYMNDARGVAQSHQLDFLDFVADDGSIISSTEWLAHVGSKMTWATEPQDWSSLGAFLTKIDTQDGAAVGLMSVATVRVGDKNLRVVGGERLNQQFLNTLALPEGMRALLYLNLDNTFQANNLLDLSGPVSEPERFAAALDEERTQPAGRTFKIAWNGDAASAETFHAQPLLGRKNELLGVLLVGNSESEFASMERRIALLAAAVAGGGLLIGLFLSWWAGARITRPLAKIAESAQRISRGDLSARVEVRGSAEIAQVAKSFNKMTEQLSEQRERLVQAERVASWRELARRLAHELKNPMSPLQATAENLQRARQNGSSNGHFDELVRESTDAMLSEINKLEKVVGRFHDFSKMPPPELAAVNVNEIVRSTAKLFEPQFGTVGRPPITSELHLEESLPTIQADPALIQRAIENLVLNAMDAMPAGGVLMMRTRLENGGVHVEVADTGTGITPEECDRLFTPYYTTKQHATGLGLAVVQSVVSDHSGRIAVDSEPGVGTSFHIFLPLRPSARPAAVAHANGDKA